MLTLLLVSLYEFKQFLQIVLWIAIPGTLIAILITTLLHYRRKKLASNEPELPAEALAKAGLLLSVEKGQLPSFVKISANNSAFADKPDWLASANPENKSLLKKYEQELRRYKENYNQLEQDFRELEGKYGDLLNKAYHNDQSGNDAIDKLQGEVKTYKLRIAQLQQALEYRDGESGAANSTMELHDLRIKLSQVEEENASLKEKIEEQQYMQDLLEEKKMQTDFLQQQLEMRIKNYHQLEKQTSGTAAEMAQLRAAAEEFNSKEQALLADLEQKQQAIQEKAAQLQQLESSMQELQQQQDSLQSIINEKQDAIGRLESTVEQEQRQTKELGRKLEMSNQLFERIYSELAKSLDGGLVPGQNTNGPAIIGTDPTAN